ncbi:glycosyltransferase involved in cell wall biosynthesis [Bacillus mesophilus]|uniref:Glycosyltransferase family 4 protein n=1 Tax=Bacillus mesophilus TaxID=1808955 RepID=A0A6M0Q7F5_9BACI|nr:glycosyltransferase family 4 protein [Bacillus mesophilus]MBM7661612.1 glycosyltransferase involved in cell wall biosynthesis [Bacillus mesophilus]NEY72281.1 glycosyltransferase family 4 protein [Bacillus mesophilus]
MRICHITSSHQYNDTRIFLKECTYLSNEYETFFIAPNAPDEKINNVHIVGVHSNIERREIRLTLNTIKVLKKALDIKADLYHFHDPEFIWGGLILKLMGKKVVYDIHEDVPRQILSKPWIRKPIRKVVSSLFETFENFAAKRFNAVVTATPFINERFTKLGCKSIDINNYPIMSELFIEDTVNAEKENAVCFVGAINRIRGPFEMIEAIEQTEGVNLYLGGTYSPKRLKEELQVLPGWEKVIDLGVINREELADIFSKSLAGLVLYLPEPNHINAQPNKMFEYMSAGLPIIASNFPLWKDIVEGNNCGLCVDPTDSKEIAKAINYIVNHPEEAINWGKNGRIAVEQKYNWETEFLKLKKLYKEII